MLFYNADLMLTDPQVGIHLLLLSLRSAQEVHADSILIQNLMYNLRTNKTVFVQSEFFNEGLQFALDFLIELHKLAKKEDGAK